MKKPIVLVIMDGVGRGDGGPGDAVKQANTPTLDKLMATCPMTWLKAHGTAVGLPTDRAQSLYRSPLNPAPCTSPRRGST